MSFKGVLICVLGPKSEWFWDWNTLKKVGGLASNISLVDGCPKSTSKLSIGLWTWKSDHFPLVMKEINNQGQNGLSREPGVSLWALLDTPNPLYTFPLRQGDENEIIGPFYVVKKIRTKVLFEQCLNLLSIFHSWVMLSPADYCWALLSACWVMLITAVRCWVCLALPNTAEHSWDLLSVFWLLLSVAEHCWALLSSTQQYSAGLCRTQQL